MWEDSKEDLAVYQLRGAGTLEHRVIVEQREDGYEKVLGGKIIRT